MRAHPAPRRHGRGGDRGPADARAPARAHLGPLTPGSGGSWRAAPCPRSASVSRGARRAAGSGGGNALGRTRGRTEDRTTTAPPPGALEGRGEPGGEGEPPSGREATERGDGPEAEVAARPARRPLPSLRGTGFLRPTHRQNVTSGARGPVDRLRQPHFRRRHQGPGGPRSSHPVPRPGGGPPPPPSPARGPSSGHTPAEKAGAPGGSQGHLGPWEHPGHTHTEQPTE